MTDWQYGRVRQARAFRIDDRLMVGVEGTRPGPDYEVSLRMYPSDSDADGEVRLGFYVRRLHGLPTGPESTCTVRMEIGLRRTEVKAVRVDHADRCDAVEVQHLPLAAPHLQGAAAETYTGWSAASFDEAYRNALARIPRAAEDEPVHTWIVAQGGVHGGLARLDDVFVTVQRVRVPRAAVEGEADGGPQRRGLKVVPT